MRVLERGDGSGFAREAGPQRGIRGELGREDLEGHGAFEAGVACAVDFAHAPGTDEAEHLVGTEADAGGETHGAAFSTTQ